MLSAISGFSGFSVDSIENVKQFYTDILGLKIDEQEGMGLKLNLPGGEASVFVYPKGEEHVPADFTVVNLVVKNIDEAVEELTKSGVEFEMYGDLGNGATQDEKGILRGLAANEGPDIAWFRDPAGNIFSVLQGE
jgi:catechol 2,3-dioxygenase-like lactoylglutathione lyase family enzyme